MRSSDNSGSLLPSGTWYAEYMRFYTAADIEELAARHSVSIALPADFEHNNERLRGIERLHCPLLDVTGGRHRSRMHCCCRPFPHPPLTMQACSARNGLAPSASMVRSATS